MRVSVECFGLLRGCVCLFSKEEHVFWTGGPSDERRHPSRCGTGWRRWRRRRGAPCRRGASANKKVILITNKIDLGCDRIRKQTLKPLRHQLMDFFKHSNENMGFSAPVKFADEGFILMFIILIVPESCQ